MKALIAIALMLLPLSLHAAGIEIGNARYVDYRNPLGRFETKYPKNWDRVEIGNAVSFIEPESENAIVSSSAVNVSVESASGVVTVDDLKRYVVNVNATRIWLPIELGGRKGFQSLNGEVGLIYLLREEGTVAIVRFQSRATELSAKDIEVIVGSLRFQ